MSRDMKGFGKNTDMVSIHKILTESIEKEEKHRKLVDNYQLNVSSLNLIAPKVTSVNPATVQEETIRFAENKTNPNNNESDEYQKMSALITKQIKDSNRVPIEKMKYPKTRAHEYGWAVTQETIVENKNYHPGGIHQETFNEITKNYWYVPKGDTDVTRFAKTYLLKEGENIFHQKK